MQHHRLGLLPFLLLLPAWAPTAQAQLTWGDVFNFEAPAEAPVNSSERLALAKPDECFAGIGVDYPDINPDGTCDEGIPKTNESYVWGLTQAGIGVPNFTGDEIWFGIATNPQCNSGAITTEPTPELTPSWVCEYGESELGRQGLPPYVGDWRRPSAYSYNLKSRQLTDRTPRDLNFSLTYGIRSAGSVGKTVFLAGPALTREVMFFAWDAETGDYKGSCRASEVDNIRSWITVNGQLFAGLRQRDGTGAIVRWTGTPDDPFGGRSDYCGFRVVTTIPGFPAYMTSYADERLAVSTWPTRVVEGDRVKITKGAVYVSPVLQPDGTFGTDVDVPWIEVWEPLDYEPDLVTATTYSAGGIAYWGGYAWFGTMHANAQAVNAHRCEFSFCYGVPSGQQEILDLFFNTYRASSIWRFRVGADDKPEVELVYGESELPALVPGTKTFESRPTGFTPLFGSSGFGNPFNTYLWAIQANDSLYLGTNDNRYVLDIDLGIITEDAGESLLPGLATILQLDEARGYGGDLWRFDSPDAAAVPESVDGIENLLNYGIRTMITLDGGSDLVLGMANAMNLEPMGGWELYLLTRGD